MPLSPNTRVGSYEVLAKLGEGGMGEVYRARDTKLGREVALKILPEAFASDPDRLMRFEREARTLATLNHPHIAQVYGLEGDASASPGQGSSTRALVMELVAGEDLSARIARGPIPLEEALPVARQIADALEAAHEAGIIHRDLKPANIKVRDDGTVKVLDFGLAKALDSAPDTLGEGATITSPAMTMRGVILGTAAYMAPEQAKGKPVDRRADIWAFGCVLYEMLTGRRAFKGDDITDTITAVLRDEPDWTALPAATPPHVTTLTSRCLVKDTRDRLRDIGEARVTLGGAWNVANTATAVGSPHTRGERFRWAAVGAVAAAAAIGFAWMRIERSVAVPAPPPVYSSSLSIPHDLELRPPSSRMALSPDGTRLVYVTTEGSVPAGRLWVRPLNGGPAQALTGTEGAVAPFWSPDSRSVAFFVGTQLRRIDVAGGPAVTVCELPWSPTNIAQPGTWSPGGVIVFSLGALHQVTASGGAPTPVTTLNEEAGETAHLYPFFLPGGDRFLFVSFKGLTPLATYAGSLNGATPTRLMDGGSNAQYADGFLLYVRDGPLMAQRFDADRLALSGAATPLAEYVLPNLGVAYGAAFSVSQTGAVVLQGSREFVDAPLVWSTRDGRQSPAAAQQAPATYGDVELSPDGTRVALTRFADRGSSDVWVLDLTRQVLTRITFDGTAQKVAWSPDGRTLVYNSRRDGTLQLFSRAVDGSGDEVAVFSDEWSKWPLGWSPDGDALLFDRFDQTLSNDIWALSLRAPGKAEPLVSGPTAERWAQFSPDGRWVAYTSDESGRREVYLRRFRGDGSRWQVSRDGGTYPRWRRDGRELYYVSPVNRMVATPVMLGDETATIGAPVDLFFAQPMLGLQRFFYDVAPDGRFLMAAVPERPRTAELTLLVNWPTLLTTATEAAP